MLATGRNSDVDNTMAELSASFSAYAEPAGDTAMLRIAEERWGKNCFRPVSSCQSTRTVSEPPEIT
jgi:hypothetical protein